jgi:uncharacterized protein involved in type VI secretion and phage assembly
MSWLNKFRNIIRQEAQRVTSEVSLPRAGRVTHYDPARYCARVLLQPEGIQTGYLPIKTEFAGNGWGDYAPPSIGQIVDVHFQQGGREAGYISGCFYSAITKPLSVPSQERWFVHKSGTAIKLTNDGNVLISAHADLRIEANNIKIHARNTYSFDANGQGQKWDGAGVETWQDDDVSKPHHNHAPPETP